MTVGIGRGFTYKLNPRQFCLEKTADFMIPDFCLIVRTALEVIANTDKPFTGNYGLKSTNPITD